MSMCVSLILSVDPQMQIPLRSLIAWSHVRGLKNAFTLSKVFRGTNATRGLQSKTCEDAFISDDAEMETNTVNPFPPERPLFNITPGSLLCKLLLGDCGERVNEVTSNLWVKQKMNQRNLSGCLSCSTEASLMSMVTISSSELNHDDNYLSKQSRRGFVLDYRFEPTVTMDQQNLMNQRNPHNELDGRWMKPKYPRYQRRHLQEGE